MEVDEPTYLKVNGPACTITPMDVLTYTRIMHKHTKAQFLASAAPASPTEISSSPHASRTLENATTKAEPVAFDSGSLHIPPPTAATSASATSNASTDASAGITATTIITTTSAAAADDDAQAHAVYSSLHTARTSAPMSALHQSLVSASALASAPLPASQSPSPSSSPAAALPSTAHLDAAADTHRRRSSAGLRKISAGLAKLGLWRGGHPAAAHPHAHQHQHEHQQIHHSQSDQQHRIQGPDARHMGGAGDPMYVDVDEVDGRALAHLQCECGICDWCRLRRGVLKRNGLCNVGVGGPDGLARVAAGRRDTV